MYFQSSFWLSTCVFPRGPRGKRDFYVLWQNTSKTEWINTDIHDIMIVVFSNFHICSKKISAHNCIIFVCHSHITRRYFHVFSLNLTKKCGAREKRLIVVRLTQIHKLPILWLDSCSLITFVNKLQVHLEIDNVFVFKLLIYPIYKTVFGN